MQSTDKYQDTLATHKGKVHNGPVNDNSINISSGIPAGGKVQGSQAGNDGRECLALIKIRELRNCLIHMVSQTLTGTVLGRDKLTYRQFSSSSSDDRDTSR